MRSSANVVLMLVHRLRRWPNIDPTLFLLGQDPGSVVFARDGKGITTVFTVVTTGNDGHVDTQGVMWKCKLT